MAASTSGNDNPLLAQLVVLTEAIKSLAEHPAAPPVSFDASTEADRIRQRVTFGYQVLGTLTGRVSSSSGNEFDVPIVLAERQGGDIKFTNLPSDARLVELRTGTEVEVLTISLDGRGKGTVTPVIFTTPRLIGSMVFLGESQGPLIAFGRRLLAAVDRVASSDHQLV
jgi:hypothetical protein